MNDQNVQGLLGEIRLATMSRIISKPIYTECAFLCRATDRALPAQNRMTLFLKQLEQLVHVFLASTEVHWIDAKPGFAFQFRG